MPKTIQLDGLPAGMTLTHAFHGEDVAVRTTEFLSSEDGEDFITRLESISDCYGAIFGPGGVGPSQVDNFLAVVGRDGKATVYCNELQLRVQVRGKGRIEPGTHVSKDQIADIERVYLLDAGGLPIIIPPDAGVALILSHRWRKGVFYDYSVLHGDTPPRTEDLSRLFGQFFARLLFQEVYSVTEDQWVRLTKWGWFPFICLTGHERQQLIGWASQDRVPTPVFDEICQTFRSSIESRVESWKMHDLLNQHMPFFESAKDAYLRGDYISCITNLYPRIEGVLRTLFVEENPGQQPTQQTMATW